MVTWNAMILGLVKCRQGQKHWNKCNTNVCDQITLTFAYVSIVVVEEGRCAHEQIIGWIITTALLTFLAILVIYKQRI
jgi:hypothetical protein